jgi:hypothetical protein
MPYRLLFFHGLVALTVAGSSVHAQTAASAPAAAPADAVDPQAVQALKDMGAYLQTLKRFRYETELTGERVLADGQKLQHSASARVLAQRPDRMQVTFSSPRSQRELYYDGKNVTLWSPEQKYYSTVSFSGTLAEMAEALTAKYGVEVPMSDLFLWGTPAAPLDKLDSAMNAGQDIIDGQVCDHYAFRQGNFDWQIWIATGKQPLPRKLVITNRNDEARPQSVSLVDWNLKPEAGSGAFTFRPPKGAKAIEIVPRKTK